MSEVLLDAAGRRRSPATMPGFHAGRPPRNKGRRYPADPPTVEEIVAVMRAAGDRRHGCRLRGLIVVLWRAGLRIHEALALNESDLDHRRGAMLVRRGKGGRRREVGMDEWAWEHLQRWIDVRLQLPVGPLFCVINGPTRGRSWSAAAARAELRRTAATAGVRRRFAPHQLRHAHAVDMAHEGVPLIVIQRQLGHSNLGITSINPQGIDNAEIIEAVHGRRAPTVPVSVSSLTLAASRTSRRGAVTATGRAPLGRVRSAAGCCVAGVRGEVRESRFLAHRATAPEGHFGGPSVGAAARGGREGAWPPHPAKEGARRRGDVECANTVLGRVGCYAREDAAPRGWRGRREAG